MSPLVIPSHYLKDLRRLTKIIQIAITFFGLVLLATIAFTGWSANNAATDRERMLVENALNQSIGRILNEQKSVAWWDDAVTNITDEKIDLEFTDANFGTFLTETYGHSSVYILNGEDRPLYSFEINGRVDPSVFERRRSILQPIIDEARGRGSILAKRPDAFGASQTSYKTLVGAVHVARWSGHVMSVDGKPSLVAAITIVPNQNMAVLKKTPNLLISTVDINEAFTSNISRSLLIPDLELKPVEQRGTAIVSDPFIGDDNIQTGYMTWKTQRPGQVLLTIILPLVALGILGTGWLSNNMFRRLERASDELTQREAKARHEAKHDALSGLPNRVQMIEKIDEFLRKRARTQSGERALAAYIDIDRFKDINDTLGHHAGDKLIKAVANRLEKRLRPEDFLARFGGDEFAILSAPSGAGGPESLADRIAQAFSVPFNIDGQGIRVTASVGIALAPEHGEAADELMRHADIALYEAKNSGRDRAVFFSSGMAKDVEDRRTIELDLRTAIEHDELRLHYQPIVSCRTGAIVGAEALLRWTHPIRGEMSPAVFIPIAENSGLMAALGTWVLNRAMADSKRWPELQIAVNLSPVQFLNINLEMQLRRLIIEHEIDPRRFILEVTENVLLEATERTKRTLEAIQAMGFKTALDDFGTGYSSLGYLSNFKFDKIKIDRSFVASMAKFDKSRTIVNSVVSLGRALGLEVVAEGVETEYEAVMMAHFGCTELQGYYFSKPIEAAKLGPLIKSFEPRRFTPASVVSAISAKGATG
jgi:diguanylate cyclase (GGDEF)-like protein